MIKNKAVRYSVILAIVGLLVSISVAWVVNRAQQTTSQNLPYLKLGEFLHQSLTKSNTLFQAALKGNDIDFQKDVIEELKKIQVTLTDVTQGNETHLGKFVAPDDEESLALLKESTIAVENLMGAAKLYWQVHNSDDYSNAAAEYGLVFTATKLSFDKLVVHVKKEVERREAWVIILAWLIAGIILIAAGLLVFFAFKYIRHTELIITREKSSLQEETKRVETLTTFIEAVSAGNYGIQIDNTDELSNKLLAMRDTLRNNAEQDKRRNWATAGHAQIGEILRDADNIHELYDNIITFVVKYTMSNQGGLFLVNEDNDEDLYLELVSCYAFERKKFISKRVELGQGLIGQCYHEGARIHLREVPEDYVNITSGLGGTTPTSLIVIPMKVDDKVYGVIELASFKKYEEHEIELVEKFAESIGSSISSIRINEKTKLLLEKTQQQTEEMRAQEEEMRQNMEELEATQEEMRRKEQHVQELLRDEQVKNEEHKKLYRQLTERERVLALTTILSEADAHGTITYANDKLSEVSKYSREEMIGKGHNLFRHPDMPADLFKVLWETIKNQKKVFRGIVKNQAKDGTHYWVDATIVPIIENGIFVKYISVRSLITNDQLALLLYNKQADKLGLPHLS